MLAVIRTGGKQYGVSVGDKIKVEKLESEEGKRVTFSDVLLVGDENGVKVGAPQVAGAAVEATVLAQGKAEKVWGVKHKAKKRYKMKFGHRQPYTEVQITKIS
ncbi:MAG TPA: 50S ribosomal protein L21 [Patescibacteria group bacterium]|nr:50S ribosomal protein L21 [Patescibacteria group bacterium]